VSTDPLRVVTYNIRSLRDDTTGVVRVLRRLEPDVVCLQEIPRFLRWRSKVAALARRSGLFYVVGSRATGATAVLASLRVDVLDRVEETFPRTPGLHRRGAAHARLRTSGGEFCATSIHLGLDASERQRHLPVLQALIDRHPDLPQIVAGDVNETPDNPVWQRLAGSLQDGWAIAPVGAELTFSATRPRRRIDGIFVSPELRVLSCGVPESPDLLVDYRRASDHRPVLAELAWGD